MLNEEIEFKEYCNLIASERLKYKNLKSGLTGLDRAMVSVARYYLFSEINSTKPIAERIAAVRTALKVWFGFEKDELDQFPEIGHTLTDYIHDLEQDTIEENAEITEYLTQYQEAYQKLQADQSPKERTKILDQMAELLESEATAGSKLETLKNQIQNFAGLEDTISKKAARLSSSPVSTKVDAATDQQNTENQISYESVIAQAMDLGPLSVRYLYYKGDEEHADPSSLAHTGSKSTSLTALPLDTVLRTTAALLLQDPGIEGVNNEIIPLQKTALANWCGTDEIGISSYNSSSSASGNSENPLFDEKIWKIITKKSEQSENFSKVKPDAAWMKHFKLIHSIQEQPDLLKSADKIDLIRRVPIPDKDTEYKKDAIASLVKETTDGTVRWCLSDCTGDYEDLLWNEIKEVLKAQIIPADHEDKKAYVRLGSTIFTDNGTRTKDNYLTEIQFHRIKTADNYYSDAVKKLSTKYKNTINDGTLKCNRSEISTILISYRADKSSEEHVMYLISPQDGHWCGKRCFKDLTATDSGKFLPQFGTGSAAPDFSVETDASVRELVRVLTGTPDVSFEASEKPDEWTTSPKTNSINTPSNLSPINSVKKTSAQIYVKCYKPSTGKNTK